MWWELVHKQRKADQYLRIRNVDLINAVKLFCGEKGQKSVAKLKLCVLVLAHSFSIYQASQSCYIMNLEESKQLFSVISLLCVFCETSLLNDFTLHLTLSWLIELWRNKLSGSNEDKNAHCATIGYGIFLREMYQNILHTIQLSNKW